MSRGRPSPRRCPLRPARAGEAGIPPQTRCRRSRARCSAAARPPPRRPCRWRSAGPLRRLGARARPGLPRPARPKVRAAGAGCPAPTSGRLPFSLSISRLNTGRRALRASAGSQAEPKTPVNPKDLNTPKDPGRQEIQPGQGDQAVGVRVRGAERPRPPLRAPAWSGPGPAWRWAPWFPGVPVSCAPSS
jgi:hypothetical protein